MAMTYANEQDPPTRADVETWQGAAVLQFGTDWCGFCRAAEPHIEQAMATVPGLHRLKVEDGKGRKLGREFAVKLWPTLVFLRDGQEVARVVRPQDAATVTQALGQIGAGAV